MQKVLHRKVTVQPGGKVEVISPELDAGQTVDVMVLHESGARGRSVMEILNSGPECRLFRTADEVRAYLAEEKASWDRCPFLSTAWFTSMPAASSIAWKG